ncbi:MAG: cytochrome c [Planctomycetia bacterium]|nr:cytochrome c [Planctomycetia bacterium]
MRNFSFSGACLLRLSLGFSALGLSLLVGCEKPGNSSPSFHLNNQNSDRDQFIVLSTDDEEQKKRKETLMIPGRDYIASALDAIFGTPDRPFVFRESGLNLKKIRLASGPVGGLRADVQAADLEALVKNRTELQKKLTDTLEPAAKKFAAAPATDEAKLKAEAEVGAAKGSLEDLNMQIESYSVLQKGLYRQHCVHCHGTTGDGAGPTALFLNPYPRDYRQGIFKFKATERSAKPTHADLTRILVDGIPDTAMPSFRLLAPDEIDALIEYVKYLSIRGEAEQALKDKIFGDEKLLPPNRAVLVKTALKDVVDTWAEAETKIVAPGGAYTPGTDQDAWLKAGEALFAGQKGQCFTCHGTTGIGDGRKRSEPLYDFWNKDKKFKLKSEEIAAALAKGNKVEAQSLTNIRNSWLLPEMQQFPRNLRLNRIRFGRAPLDIYRRIFVGINGTEMPGAGPPSPGQPAKLTDQEIWQLVDYVLTLPFYDENGNPPHGSDGHKAHAADGHGHASHLPPTPATANASAGNAKLAGGE